MNVKFVADNARYRSMTTKELRENYLVTELFQHGQIQLHYMDIDRCVIGSAVPTEGKLTLETSKELAADFFSQRREIGVINIGNNGAVTVDGEKFEMAKLDSLYLGRGSREIAFASADATKPAMFYFLSYPAHQDYATKLISKEQANQVHLGSDKEANKRTIYQAICPGVVESCQIVMGFTVLHEGNVWNTMPPHTHHRRSEVYMYFDLEDDARVFHLMGEPSETRSLVMKNRQAVISPSWSIHCGAGTSSYTFVWCMGGENQEFTDMDGVAMKDLL